jgi:cell division protein FtsL
MVIGIVTLNAFLAQASFRIQELETTISGLSERRLALEYGVARLSSPGRLADWASDHGMELPGPGQVHLLRVGGARGSEE